MVWANCMSPCNSIAGLYIEGTRDVISDHGNSQGPQKRPINFSFCKLSVKLIRWPAIFISSLEASLSSLTFQTVWKKRKCNLWLTENSTRQFSPKRLYLKCHREWYVHAKFKVDHRAKFRAKSKYFLLILFPVRATSRKT